MKIEYLLEKIITGTKVRFEEGEIKSGPYNGNKIIIVKSTESNKKFVLLRSLTNFVRFQRWVDKTARADISIQKGKIHTNEGWLSPIRISTVVELEKVNRSNDDEGDYSWDYDPEEPPDIRQGHAGTE